MRVLVNRFHSGFLKRLSHGKRRLARQPLKPRRKTKKRVYRMGEIWKPLRLQLRLRGNGCHKAKLRDVVQYIRNRRMNGRTIRSVAHVTWLLNRKGS